MANGVPVGTVLEYVDRLRRSPDRKHDFEILNELEDEAKGFVPVENEPSVENLIPGQLDIESVLREVADDSPPLTQRQRFFDNSWEPGDRYDPLG